MTADLVLDTPFTPLLAPFCRTGEWQNWSGYRAVGTYWNTAQEYSAIRNAASLYDISPMFKYRVEGPDAARFVDRLTTRPVAKLAPGRASYAVWCDGAGRVIEDGTVFRLGPDLFQINAAEPQLAWFADTAFGLDVTIADRSAEIGAVSVQGPLSRQLLTALGFPQVESLRYFGIVEAALDGVPVTISRTGFTGDLGFELWVAAEDAAALGTRLLEVGLPMRLKPIGSSALDIARIEAGHIQIQADYVSALTAVGRGEARSPFELGLDWAIDFAKPQFNGRRALLREREDGGPPLRLVGLAVEGTEPAVDTTITRRGRRVGETTSAVWSPILKGSIALALVEARHAAIGTRLTAEIEWRREQRLLSRSVACTVVDRRFYEPERRRA